MADDGFAGSGVTLVGLFRERQAFLSAIRQRESVVFLGPAGSGKTALVRSVLDGEMRGTPVVHVSRFDTLHDLLVKIARGLLQSGHCGFRRAVQVGWSEWERWLSGQTSVHLKGLLWDALEQAATPIVLDGINRAGHPTYRFLRRLYFAPGMTVIATARDPDHLGELGRLFWDPRKIRHMQPLSDAEALRLFEAAVDHFRIRDLLLDDFREKSLHAAKGNPGQIVEMCRLAANPMYVTGGRRIKFAPLRIDVMMRLL